MISKEGRLILLSEFPMGDYAKKKALEEIRNSGNAVSADSGWVTFNAGTGTIISQINTNSSTSIYNIPIENTIQISEAEIENEKLRKEKERLEKEEKKAKLNKEFPVETFVNKLLGLSEYLRGEVGGVTPNQSWEMIGDHIIISPSDQSPTDYRTYWNEVEYQLTEMTMVSGSIKRDNKFRKLINNVIKRSRQYFEKSIERQDPIEVMNHFKDALEILDADEVQLQRIEKYIESLNVTGQKGTIRIACMNLLIQNLENKLLIDGRFTKYVTEEQAVNFIRQSKRGLALDLMKDFPRVIPEDVIEKFKEAEELKVFDNYLILHYLPKKEQKNRGMTQEQMEAQRKKEIERKKDPILFGVIRGSRRLYYIADWIDDYCDLTLDEFMKAIQSEPKNLNEYI